MTPTPTKRTAAALAASALLLSACVQTATPEQTVLGTAAAGAAAGALIGDNRLEGAAIGGVLGAVAGAAINEQRQSSGRCLYRDAYGREYYAAC